MIKKEDPLPKIARQKGDKIQCIVCKNQFPTKITFMKHINQGPHKEAIEIIKRNAENKKKMIEESQNRPKAEEQVYAKQEENQIPEEQQEIEPIKPPPPKSVQRQVPQSVQQSIQRSIHQQSVLQSVPRTMHTNRLEDRQLHEHEQERTQNRYEQQLNQIKRRASRSPSPQQLEQDKEERLRVDEMKQLQKIIDYEVSEAKKHQLQILRLQTRNKNDNQIDQEELEKYFSDIKRNEEELPVMEAQETIQQMRQKLLSKKAKLENG